MKRKHNLLIKSIVGTITLFGIFQLHSNIKLMKEPIVYYDNYNIDSQPLYASLNGLNIFITSQKNFETKNAKDIVIIDLREIKQDMCILNSHQVNNLLIKSKIIDVILKYNEEFPSSIPWIRSKESITNEWLVHNLAYLVNYERQRSADVDLENDEEDDYKIKLFQ